MTPARLLLFVLPFVLLMGQTREIVLVDPVRQRSIPVVMDEPSKPLKHPFRLAILNPGYGEAHTAYSFLARHLAGRGFLVASIQHELPGDPPLPLSGPPAVVRKPAWERGVATMLFVIHALRTAHPDLDPRPPVLLGHSHGGDTAVLFAHLHPAAASAVITLDHRRMPLPRASHPPVLSLRSSDQQPDPGVLPSPAELAGLPITVIHLPATPHNDMTGAATPQQKAEILRHIDAFLRNPPHPSPK